MEYAIESLIYLLDLLDRMLEENEDVFLDALKQDLNKPMQVSERKRIDIYIYISQSQSQSQCFHNHFLLNETIYLGGGHGRGGFCKE